MPLSEGSCRLLRLLSSDQAQRVLTCLHGHPEGVTAAALLEGARMKQADVSRMLARLADYGLVVSTRPSESSRRGRPPLLWRASGNSPAWDLLHLAEQTTKSTRSSAEALTDTLS
jgi:predicted ArsR family transcriptional regulator